MSVITLALSGNASFDDGSSEPLETYYDPVGGIHSPTLDVSQEVSARISQQVTFAEILEDFIQTSLTPIYPTGTGDVTLEDVTPENNKTLTSLNLHIRGNYTPDDRTEHKLSWTYEWCLGQNVEHLFGASSEFTEAADMDDTVKNIIINTVENVIAIA
jgi:hypothetical protein